MALQAPKQAQKTDQIQVTAFSLEHAKFKACALAGITTEQITDVITKKVNRPAKTCKTDNFPARGARKWRTVYEVYAYGERIPLGNGTYQYLYTELVEGGFASQTEAQQYARDMAIKHHIPMMVQIGKEIDNGSPVAVDLYPKAGEGTYVVLYRE